jgi:hypothetical protein
MAKITRYSVFETNSSSSHSITFGDKCKVYETIIPNSKGEIILEGGRFEVFEESYSSPVVKANYLAQSCVDPYLLLYVIKSHTRAKSVILNIDPDFCHNPLDSTPFEEIFKGEKSLKEFLFNPNHLLNIDYTD